MSQSSDNNQSKVVNANMQHIGLLNSQMSQTQSSSAQNTIRSPRLSPLHKFDTMMMENHKKVNSDFPSFVSKHQRQLSHHKNSNLKSQIPEIIEEDKKEED
jgi:hypothetical protein